MELLTPIAELVGALAWPVAVLTLVLVFRRQIQQRLTSVTEVKYPGGSILMREVERLEARVEKTPERVTLPRQNSSSALPRPHSDSLLAVAQMRLDIERELFLLSRNTLNTTGDAAWTVVRYTEELERAGILKSQAADDVRDFISLANTIIHGADVPEDAVQRAALIGGVLFAMLRHKRVVAEAERDFQGHLLWHIAGRKGHASENARYHYWSAVAASLPDIHYDFDIYREAAEHHHEKVRSGAHPGPAFYILTLDEFVSVLEFREKELMRLIRSWGSQEWGEGDRALEWQWPREWDIEWNGPILREKAHLWGAEEDLMRTRAALDVHRQRLIADRRRESR